MTLNNKILPVALAAALLGGSVGVLVSHSTKTTETPVAATSTTTPSTPTADNLTTNNGATAKTQTPTAGDEQVASNTTEDQTTYRNGYQDALNDTRNNTRDGNAGRTTVVNRSSVRNVPVQSGRYNNSRQVYYDYSRPQKRSFWQKHRDKLTVAGGTGLGAIIGGLIGGKKGAAIGALGGAGGSALYTYKIRKRHRQY